MFQAGTTGPLSLKNGERSQGQEEGLLSGFIGDSADRPGRNATPNGNAGKL